MVCLLWGTGVEQYRWGEFKRVSWYFDGAFSVVLNYFSSVCTTVCIYLSIFFLPLKTIQVKGAWSRVYQFLFGNLNCSASLGFWTIFLYD